MALGPAEAIGGVAIGVAVGEGVAGVVEPLVQDIVNQAWSDHPSKPLESEAAAQLVAEDYAPAGAYSGEAAKQGLNGDRFAGLVHLAQTAPGAGELIAMLQRGTIGPGEFQAALAKGAMLPNYRAALQQLAITLLTPEQLAAARQYGYIEQDRQHTEAAQQGVDGERAEIMFESAGLPPGPGEALTMLRRNIIDPTTFVQMIREGNTKVKYTDEFLKLQANILTVAEAAEGVIRERITPGEGQAIAAQNGYSAGDFGRLVEFGGRPPGIGQGLQMLNRGVIDEPAFREIVARSNVRTEYTNDYLGLRYHAPSLFQIARLAAAGDVTDATIHRWLIWQNFSPADATELAAGFGKAKTQRTKDLTAAQIETLYEGRIYSGGEATTLLTKLGYDAQQIDALLKLADARRERRFLEAAVSAVHSQYVNHKIARGVAINLLGEIIPTSDFRDDLMALWDMERDAHTRPLSEGQITTALRHQAIGGQTAHDRLTTLGVTDQDARIIVSTVTGHFGGAGELAAKLP